MELTLINPLPDLYQLCWLEKLLLSFVTPNRNCFKLFMIYWKVTNFFFFYRNRFVALRLITKDWSLVFGETSNERSSHRRCSVRKYILRNFAKFTWKHQCQSLQLYLKRYSAQVFSCEYYEISKNTFFTEHPLATASEVKTIFLRTRTIL